MHPDRGRAPARDPASVAAAVREEIEARLGRFLAAGLAVLTVDGDMGDFELVPAAPGAAGVTVTVSGDEVVVGVGNGVVDIFCDADPDWHAGFGELLDAVAAGRVEERVTRGPLFRLKVVLRFPGTRLAAAQFVQLQEDPAPRVGVRRYRAWER